jgi:hypothetical protein
MGYWSEAMSGAGGGVLAALVAWVVGRSDTAQTRRDQRIAEVALRTVEDSEKFVLQASQREINRELREDVKEVKTTVKTFDAKLDRLLYSKREKEG